MYSMMNSAGLRTMAGTVAGFSQVMARRVGNVGIAGIDPEVIANVVDDAPQVTRDTATVDVDRRELLERLKTAAKGDGAILSVNGRVDISAIFGRSLGDRRDIADDGTVRILGRSFARDYDLKTRDTWDRSGELIAEIDAQKLAKIIGKVKSDRVQLELWRETGADGVTESGLLVKTDKAEFSLDVSSADDWEDRPTLETDSVVLVDSQELRRGILAVVDYCDCESTRYALGGVNVELTTEGITLAATDSRRLGIITIPCEFGDGFADGMGAIPKEAMRLIADQLKGEAGSVALAVCTDGFQVESEAWTVSGKVIEGRFPNWRMVIPAEFSEYVKIDRAELVECLETAALCCNPENRGCDFTLTDSGMTLETSGDGKCRVTCSGIDCAYGGVEWNATLDARFVLQYLKSTAEEFVVAAVIDSGSAMMWEAEGAARYVMMPLSKDR